MFRVFLNSGQVTLPLAKVDSILVTVEVIVLAKVTYRRTLKGTHATKIQNLSSCPATCGSIL